MFINKRFLSPDAAATGGDYGYVSDEVKTSPFNFGLNAGVTKMVKFEWIPNAGKDGAEGEALDIVFNINGTDKNYRKFPVTKAYGKNGEEITDRNSQEFKDALADFNQTVVHILHAFIPDDVLRPTLSRPFTSFKEYAQFITSLLPNNYKEIPLDIFLQYQWQISDGQTRTFLEIPKKMKYGAWLKPAQAGSWKENKAENIDENTRKALWYTNENGQEHPFVKNGWFMLSNFANQQRNGAEESNNASGAANMNAGTTNTAAGNNPATGSAPVTSSW